MQDFHPHDLTAKATEMKTSTYNIANTKVKITWFSCLCCMYTIDSSKDISKQLHNFSGTDLVG